MSRQLRSWILLGLLLALSLAGGYALPHPESMADAKKARGDMLDAVAAVQRRSPLFLTTERGCSRRWVTEGGIYLSRTSKTPDDVEDLRKDPRYYDNRWHGVVYFKAYADRDRVSFSFMSGAGDRLLDYGDFVVYGDPELVQEVRSVLTSAGFEPTADASQQAPSH